MSAGARQQKHEEERPCCGRHFIFIQFYYFLLNCGRYRHCVWPIWFVADVIVSRSPARLQPSFYYLAIMFCETSQLIQ